MEKEFQEYKENSVDLEKYKKLSDDLKRKKQRVNSLSEENENFNKSINDLKLKCDNFKNEISKIKNEKKLDGNKIKIQMTQEIEDLAAQNASLEHKYAVLQSQINEMKIEIKQIEIIKQSLLNQIKDKNIELSNQKTEFNDIINNYETKISTMLNSNYLTSTKKDNIIADTNIQIKENEQLITEIDSIVNLKDQEIENLKS